MRYTGSSANLHHYRDQDAGHWMEVMACVKMKRNKDGVLTKGAVAEDTYRATVYRYGVGIVAMGIFRAHPRDGRRAPQPTDRQATRMCRALRDGAR